MVGRTKTPYRAIARPESAREPAFVRACAVFVETLPLALRTALVISAAVFVHELHDFTGTADERKVDLEKLVKSSEAGVAEPADSAPIEPVLTDRVKHYLNCTYEDYRNEHFDSCVEQQSQIYRAPGAAPDETGRLPREAESRFALVMSFDAATPDS